MTFWLVIIFIVLGVLFILLAGIGLLRMPDFYMRVSISTKAVTLGVGLILVAAAISFNDFAITTRVLAIIVFVLMTAPVGAHMIGRASYFTGVRLWKDSVCDDLEGKYDKKSHQLEGDEKVKNSKKGKPNQ
jgi:multicomponent Na+:H+ antiporter subunit G